VTGTGQRGHRPSDERPDGITRQKDSELGGRRPPEYVVVIAASDWVKERFPRAEANLWDALQTGQDRHRDLEPDLEAEP